VEDSPALGCCDLVEICSNVRLLRVIHLSVAVAAFAIEGDGGKECNSGVLVLCVGVIVLHAVVGVTQQCAESSATRSTLYIDLVIFDDDAVFCEGYESNEES